MNETVLVTGASGFIGREVVRQLAAAGTPVTAFSRSGGENLPGVTVLRGDLLEASDLDRACGDASAVIHLAAATGKASPSEMHRINVDGTQALLNACERHSIRRLVHVSTIAAKYPDLSSYPYGQSKLEAERRVMASAFDWTVVRPTIVLGPDSPALGPLRSLATGPALMLPGGGRVAVQPIDVRDVASSLTQIMAAAESHGTVVDLGGPERSTMKRLLESIRTSAGKTAGPVLPLPLGPLGLAAKVATGILGSRSPVTPGQLTVFRFDSVAADPPPGCPTSATYDIDSMLREA